MDLNSFIEAFSANWGTIAFKCNCGITYYERDGCFDIGEREEYEENQKATEVENISIITFEGNYYAEVCKCWDPRADQLMKFLDSHSLSIARYLNAEKKRLLSKANSMPSLDIN